MNPERDFDLALISRLRFQHPHADIDAIADQIAADPSIRNVNAMLTARVRHAGSLPKPAEKPTTTAEPGGFNPDGTWYSHGSGKDALTRFVWMLCNKRRNNPSFSPADAQALIEASEYADAFDDFSVNKPDDPASWPGVASRRSATECVKRAGYGSDGYWAAGAWLPSRSRPELGNPNHH
jgi:hypothetical protein